MGIIEIDKMDTPTRAGDEPAASQPIKLPLPTDKASINIRGPGGVDKADKAVSLAVWHLFDPKKTPAADMFAAIMGMPYKKPPAANGRAS